MLIITQVLFLIFFQTNVSHGSRRQRAQALNQWAQWCKIELLKATQCDCKKSTTGHNNLLLKCACGHTSQKNYKLQKFLHFCCEFSFESYFTWHFIITISEKIGRFESLLCYVLVTLNCILKIAPGLFKIAPGSCQIPVNQAQVWNEKCPWFPLAYLKAVCFISLSCRL